MISTNKKEKIWINFFIYLKYEVTDLPHVNDGFNLIYPAQRQISMVLINCRFGLDYPIEFIEC